MTQKRTAAAVKNEADNASERTRHALLARTNDINSATSQFFVNLKGQRVSRSLARQFGYAVSRA